MTAPPCQSSAVLSKTLQNAPPSSPQHTARAKRGRKPATQRLVHMPPPLPHCTPPHAH